MSVLMSSEIPALGTPRTGKVREVYDLGDSLLIVATDRISAFDVIMPNGIPDKGRILMPPGYGRPSQRGSMQDQV